VTTAADHLKAALASPSTFAQALAEIGEVHPERTHILHRHLLAMVRLHRRGEFHLTGALIDPWLEEWAREKAAMEDIAGRFPGGGGSAA